MLTRLRLAGTPAHGRNFRSIPADKISEMPHLTALPGSRASAKYQHIPTGEVLAKLAEYGWKPTSACAVRSRETGTGKHAICLENDAFPEIAAFGGLRPRLYVVNSHDTMSCCNVQLGFIRLVCMNGLVAGHSFWGQKIRHVGRAAQMSELERKLACVAEAFAEAMKDIDIWTGLVLDEVGMQRFAIEALRIRYGQTFIDALEKDEVRRRVESLLRVSRPEDEGNTVWAVFNRVQENITRGRGFVGSLRSGVKAHDVTQKLWDAASRAAA